jgi:aspartate kinase
MIIYKFGGTSVGNADRMKQVANIISDEKQKIIVLSAVGGTTNKLVRLTGFFYTHKHVEAVEIINLLREEYSGIINDLFSTGTYQKKATDFIEGVLDLLLSQEGEQFNEQNEKLILAQGEIMSTNLFYLYLLETGASTSLIPALDYMRVDGDGEPDIAAIARLLEPLLDKVSDKHLIVTQGFICRNIEGQIDNLKRGGSDYSATLVGQAINAKEVQIWTDIDGMHNNDPRVVENTYPIDYLSFDEAAELAYFGAKILHPASVLPAREAGIPVRLKNTFDPAAFGTLISATSEPDKVKAIAAKDGIIAINIISGRMLLAFGFLRRVFEVFEKYRTSIDMITTSEVAVTLTIDDTCHLKQLIAELNTLGTVMVEDKMSIVAVVGNGAGGSSKVLSKITEALNGYSVRMVSFGGSHNNISLLVSTSDKISVLKSLNTHIF